LKPFNKTNRRDNAHLDGWAQGGGPTTHKRRTIGKDLSEREEMQKMSVASDGGLSSKLHYEVFSTSVTGRRKVQRHIVI
jgi:hypothetical protein